MIQRHESTPGEALGLLSDRRRRYVLHSQRTAESDVIEFDPLIDWVTEQFDDRGSPCEDYHERLEASLHRVHLPEVEAIGVLDYDWRRRTIRYRESDELEAHLELAGAEDLS